MGKHYEVFSERVTSKIRSINHKEKVSEKMALSQKQIQYNRNAGKTFHFFVYFQKIRRTHVSTHFY